MFKISPFLKKNGLFLLYLWAKIGKMYVRED